MSYRLGSWYYKRKSFFLYFQKRMCDACRDKGGVLAAVWDCVSACFDRSSKRGALFDYFFLLTKAKKQGNLKRVIDYLNKMYMYFKCMEALAAYSIQITSRALSLWWWWLLLLFVLCRIIVKYLQLKEMIDLSRVTHDLPCGRIPRCTYIIVLK